MKIPKAQISILKVLADGQLHNFRDIATTTGKYSNLPGELRGRHERSLGSKGLVRELQIKIGNETVNAFQITPAGFIQLGLPVKTIDHDKAEADFIARYSQWLTEYKREEEAAARIDLKRNEYVLLRALGDGRTKNYVELVKASGIFSGLPQYLRSRHARHGSLGSKGLIKESYEEHENENRSRPIFTFTITKKGLTLLARCRQASAQPNP